MKFVDIISFRNTSVAINKTANKQQNKATFPTGDQGWIIPGSFSVSIGSNFKVSNGVVNT